MARCSLNQLLGPTSEHPFPVTRGVMLAEPPSIVDSSVENPSHAGWLSEETHSAGDEFLAL
jgi:hypothetical protein